MIYTYAYPKPSVTVDIIVLREIKDLLHILLIERKNPPYKLKWAMPGGFIDMNEELIDSAYRELKEETSIGEIKLSQFKTFGKPGRDPRGRTISIVYYGYLHNLDQKIEADDDASATKWFPIEELPDMAFDHNKIILDFLKEKSSLNKEP